MPTVPVIAAAQASITANCEGRDGLALPFRVVCPIVALVFGAAAAWAARSTMFPDGISYLDIGEAYWRHDWHNAINAYWSPLYSWILGGFLGKFKPSIQTEFPLVHVVNFLIYVVALGAFAFFLETFVGQQLEKKTEIATESQIALPVWAWYVVGYSTFITASLFLITISFASGDMAVSGIVYFASALLLRVQSGKANTATFVLLGLALGIGYYAKTAMLLMAFPFLIVAATAQLRRGASLRLAGLSFLVFIVTAAPFMVALSIVKDRPTFGDSGSINYMVNVGKVQFFIPHESGVSHPVHRIPGAIEAYEYAHTISGTYPLWTDPSYWHEGIRLHFDLARQIRTLALSAAEFFWISFNVFLGLHISAAILFLYLISPVPSRSFAVALRHWVLWIPSLAGIALYALVVIEPRYVGGLFCVLWMVAFSGVRLPRNESARYLITAAVLVAGLVTCTITFREIYRTSHGIGVGERNIATPECSKVAAALVADGVGSGDKVAIISDWLFPSREGAYIARLAHLQIIGEARPDDFWTADESTRARLIATFADAGTAALLTYKPQHTDAGWQRLAGTDYYLYRISATHDLPALKEKAP